MNATIYTPVNELKDTIDHIWCHEEEYTDITSYSIPFLNQELILNFGEQFTVSSRPYGQFAYTRQAAVSGICTQPMLTTVKGRYKAIGVMFKPYGLATLLGISAARLNNSPLALEQINRTGSSMLDIETAGSPIEKIKKLEQELLRIARPTPIPKDILHFSEEVAEEPLKKGRIKGYMHTTGWKPKRFIAAFSTFFGVTPQKYIHTVQVNKAIAFMAANPGISLSETAYENGFYDQAHFIKTFRQLAGITPGAYLKALKANKVFAHFPNTIWISPEK